MILVIVAAFVAGSITAGTFAFAAKGDPQGQPFQELGKKIDELKSQLESLIAQVDSHDKIISEMTKQPCPDGQVVQGFDSNGKMICVADDVGEQTQFNVITRREQVAIEPNTVTRPGFPCEPGEIILGGKIKGPEGTSIISGRVDNGAQTYFISVQNNNEEKVTITVTWSCLQFT